MKKTTDTKCLVELDHFGPPWYKGRVAYKPLKLESRPSPVFFQRFTGGWWDSVSYEEDSA